MDNLINRGGITADILWTNSNISSNFAAQTITIDNLDKYKIIIIQTLFRKGWSGLPMKNEIAIAHSSGILMLVVSRNGEMYNRNYTVSSDGITFETGRIGSNNSDEVLIPVNIYGIR